MGGTLFLFVVLVCFKFPGTDSYNGFGGFERA